MQRTTPTRFSKPLTAIVLALAMTALTFGSLAAKASDTIPTPIWPIGAISNKEPPAYKWTSVPGAVDYQIRIHRPIYHQDLPVRVYPQGKYPKCAQTPPDTPSQDFTYFVDTPEERAECPPPSHNRPPNANGRACVTPHLCTTPNTADNFSFQNSCHPLRTLTGCVSGAPVISGLDNNPQICSYSWAGFTGFPNPPPLPPSNAIPRPTIEWVHTTPACNGAPWTYAWAVRAIFKTDDGKATRFGEWSGFVDFHYDENAGRSPPPPPAPPTPAKDHPVTFINDTKMGLYVYSGTGDCTGWSDLGLLPSAGKLETVVPARKTQLFTFQKDHEACTHSMQYTQRSASGGSATREFIHVQ